MTSGPAAPDDQHACNLAAVSYVLTWVTGIVVLVLADEDERFARWHAIQAIGLGVAFYALSTAIGFVSFFVAVVAFFATHGGLAEVGTGSWIVVGLGALSVLSTLFSLAVVISFAVKAYRGETLRVPLVARFADRYA